MINLVKITSIEHDILTTAVSAKFVVIGGGSCCCAARILNDYGITIHYDYCLLNPSCNNCSSFTLTDLIPNTHYRIIFTTVDGSEVERKFRTKYLNVKIKPFVSFQTAQISFLMDYDVSPDECSYKIYTDYNNDIFFCSQDCKNCSFIYISNLSPNTIYNIYYENYYTYDVTQKQFTTLDVTEKFPQLEAVVQYNDITIAMSIDNTTPYDYEGEYDVFVIINETIPSNPTHYAAIKKDVFDKKMEMIYISIEIIYELYLVQVCFDIHHPKCDNQPNMFYCSVFSHKVLKVCTGEMLHNTSGKFYLEKQQNVLVVSHTLEAINCHEELICFITFIQLLRKSVSIQELHHFPDQKFYFLNGMVINYVAKLNETECPQNMISINSSSTYSGKKLITSRNVYYTVSFITCNTLSCFPSKLYNILFVTGSQIQEMLVVIIFGFISILLLLISTYLVKMHDPKGTSGEKESYDVNSRIPPSMLNVGIIALETTKSEDIDPIALNINGYF